MIKIYCNKCGKQTTKFRQIHKNINKTMYNLCSDCSDKWQVFHTHTANVDIEDFMTMSDEDIELALYTFKVGDQVITSTGEVGIITDICTCDQCKNRGFYEPQVKTEIGNYTIYITDNDKRVNFRSFYRIGDRVFGNIDEDVLKDHIENKKADIRQGQLELIQLNCQLDVVKKLKEEKENEL